MDICTSPLSIDPNLVSQSISYTCTCILFSESCMTLSVPEHLCIPIFYSCDSNNNLQANLIFATNLTHSITTIQMCDNGVWIATDQTPSNGRLKNINICRGVPETFYTVCQLDGVSGTPPPPPCVARDKFL